MKPYKGTERREKMNKYEGSIQSVNARDHIRLRPSMYIGSVNERGRNYLLFGFLRMLCIESRPNCEIQIRLSDESTTILFKETFLHQLFKEQTTDQLKSLVEIGPTSFSHENNHYLIPVLFHLTSAIQLKGPKGNLITSRNGEFDFNPTKIETSDWLRLEFQLDEEIFDDVTFNRVSLAIECEKLAALCSHVAIELSDNSKNSDYREKFTLPNGLLDLFDNKLERRYFQDEGESFSTRSEAKTFHVLVQESELSLELIVSPSRTKESLERSYYRFIHLAQGGSHVSYFSRRMKRLNKKLNKEITLFEDDLKFFHLMTNIETKQAFTFVGPTKTRIEDPLLVQIMKSAFDQIEPEIIDYFSRKYSD